MPSPGNARLRRVGEVWERDKSFRMSFFCLVPDFGTDPGLAYLPADCRGPLEVYGKRDNCFFFTIHTCYILVLHEQGSALKFLVSSSSAHSLNACAAAPYLYPAAIEERILQQFGASRGLGSPFVSPFRWSTSPTGRVSTNGGRTESRQEFINTVAGHSASQG